MKKEADKSNSARRGASLPRHLNSFIQSGIQKATNVKSVTRKASHSTFHSKSLVDQYIIGFFCRLHLLCVYYIQRPPYQYQQIKPENLIYTYKKHLCLSDSNGTATYHYVIYQGENWKFQRQKYPTSMWHQAPYFPDPLLHPPSIPRNHQSLSMSSRSQQQCYLDTRIQLQKSVPMQSQVGYVLDTWILIKFFSGHF